MVRKLTTEEFISKAIAIHGDKYDYGDVVYINCRTNIKIYCNKCKRYFEQTPNNHLHGQGCYYCNNNRYKYFDQEVFINRCKKVHGDRYDYDKTLYKGMREKIEIYCKMCKKYFWQRAGIHVRGGKCLHGKNPIKWTQKSFIEEAIRIHKDKYDYTKVKYKDMDTPVKIFCNKCKKYFKQIPCNHLKGSDCKCYLKEKLHNRQAWSSVKFIENAKKIHKDRYDYSLVEYYNCKTPVKIKCCDCNTVFLQSPDSHLLGKGCPKCCASRGENMIEDWLVAHAIQYSKQYRYKDCKDKRPLPFDFYLPDYNACIEFQGEQHYKKGIKFFTSRNKDLKKAEEKFKLQKKHDRIKKKYCKNNNINFLEIKYNENVEEKLQECINNLNSSNHKIKKE